MDERSRVGACLVLSCWIASCGGSTTGSASNNHGDAGPTSDGSAASGGASTGGAVSSGGEGAGAVGTGGRPGAGGTRATGGVLLDPCAGAGCAPPPMCDTGCREQCGCCPCTEGEMIPVADGAKICRGGCYVIEPLPEAGVGCLYDGVTHPPNSVFYASDDCNVCTCGAGGLVSCSKKVCPPCDSSMDDHRHKYVGQSPMACMTIRYKCPANTTGFQNTCGCGCEQDASCPEFFNCEPSPGTPGCDTQMLQMQCPYSGIAF